MKSKRLAIIIVALLLVPVFGGIVAFAPAPGDIPNRPVDVFVTNTNDNPVPVDITDDSIDVNLDEPIEVTNPSGESLDVKVTNALDLDVSGWVHTTQEEWIEYVETYPSTPISVLTKTTKGYREITMVFQSHGSADNEFKVYFRMTDGGGVVNFQVDIFTVTGGDLAVKTYAIQGSSVHVDAQSMSGGNGEVSVWYYMTT